MKAFVGAAIGALLGFLVVRSFFLNPLEEIGVRLFFHSIGGGTTGGGNFDPSRLFEFEATWKLLAGTILGAAGGYFAGSKVKFSSSAPSHVDAEPEADLSTR